VRRLRRSCRIRRRRTGALLMMISGDTLTTKRIAERTAAAEKAASIGVAPWVPRGIDHRHARRTAIRTITGRKARHEHLIGASCATPGRFLAGIFSAITAIVGACNDRRTTVPMPLERLPGTPGTGDSWHVFCWVVLLNCACLCRFGTDCRRGPLPSLQKNPFGGAECQRRWS